MSITIKSLDNFIIDILSSIYKFSILFEFIVQIDSFIIFFIRNSLRFYEVNLQISRMNSYSLNVKI